MNLLKTLLHNRFSGGSFEECYVDRRGLSSFDQPALPSADRTATISRENRIRGEQGKATGLCKLTQPPAAISLNELILDFDATDDLTYGMQEKRFFHGYYDHYCFLPLYVFCGDQLLCAYLRPSKIDAAKHSQAIPTSVFESGIHSYGTVSNPAGAEISTFPERSAVTSTTPPAQGYLP